MPYIITKITDSKEDLQKFIDRFGEERLAKLQRFKPAMDYEKRDIYYWMDKTREDLEREFNNIILKGEEYIGENEEWLVVKITSKEQLKKLASDMPWCIKQGEEFDIAQQVGVNWYLFINKNDKHNKIMVAELNGNAEITDNHNHRISSIPNAPKDFNFESSISDDSFLQLLLNMVESDDTETLINKFGDFFGDLSEEDENLKETLTNKLLNADLSELANYIDTNIRKFI